MNDAHDDLPPIHQPPTRHAAEWGFASLFMSGVLAVVAILTLQINLQLFLSPPVWARDDLRNIQYASIAGVFVVLGLILASGAFAVTSLFSALRSRQPCALGLAGLLLSVLALLMWIGVFVDLFAVLDMLMRRQGVMGIF